MSRTFIRNSGFGNEFSVKVKNVSVSQRGKVSPDGSSTSNSSSYLDEKMGNLFTAAGYLIKKVLVNQLGGLLIMTMQTVCGD